MAKRTRFLKQFRFCPRCGEKLAICRGEKFDRCSQCGFKVFDLTVPSVTAVIVNAKGEALLTRRGRAPHRGKWGTLGGFVDRGETAEEAVRREAWEELGIRLGTVHYLGTHPLEYPYQKVNSALLEVAFLAYVRDPKPKARDDITEARFFKLSEVPYRALAWPSQRKYLRALAAGKIDIPRP
jgi:NAD+ diphosphatase